MGYHIVNFAITIAAAFFLFLLISPTLTLPTMNERYGNITYPAALLSTLLWATSPLHVHAATNILPRMARLAGLFYVATPFFYVRPRSVVSRKVRIAHSLLCGLCAWLAFATT